MSSTFPEGTELTRSVTRMTLPRRSSVPVLGNNAPELSGGAVRDRARTFVCRLSHADVAERRRGRERSGASHGP